MSATNTQAAYLATLQPMTWRGMTLNVKTVSDTFTRKVITHDYPYSDTQDIEDLGLGPKRVSVEVYFVDDMVAQAQAFRALLTQAGSGVLVHPVFGSITARVMSQSNNLAAATGGIITFRVEFIEDRDTAPTQTTTQADTAQDASDAADSNDDASDSDYWDNDNDDTDDDTDDEDATDDGDDDDPDDVQDGFFDQVSGAVTLGAEVIGNVADTVLEYAADGLAVINTEAGYAAGVIQDGLFYAQTLVGTAVALGNTVCDLANDATLAVNSVQGLLNTAGPNYWYGRYDVGNLSTQPALLTSTTFTGNIQQRTQQATALLLTQSTTARANTIALTQQLPTLAENAVNQAGALAFTQAITATTESLRTSALSPLDAVRLLTPLASLQVVPLTTSGPVPRAQNTLVSRAAARVRRAALSSIARATSQYQPRSQDDVVQMFTLVAPLFDAEIENAGTVGDDMTFQSLRDLKAAVAVDLQTRAVNLPSSVTVLSQVPMPAAALAWLCYQDASRADEIVALNDAVNPLFLPTISLALSS